MIEDTREEKRPFKFYFSNLPESTSLWRLVTLIKLRWRVERDYQELKGELGLDHFTITRPCVRSLTVFLRSDERLFTRSKVTWTLPMVRRHLQQVLLMHIGWCPLCARPVDGRSPPKRGRAYKRPR